MDRKLSRQILVVLTIVYGCTVAALGFFESPALGPVAVVGALVIGGLWAIRGAFLDRRRGPTA
jgi:hypothetical protein